MIAKNYDWFIVLFAPVLIGRSDYFVVGFLKSSLLEYRGYYISARGYEFYLRVVSRVSAANE